MILLRTSNYKERKKKKRIFALHFHLIFFRSSRIEFFFFYLGLELVIMIFDECELNKHAKIIIISSTHALFIFIVRIVHLFIFTLLV